MPEIRFVVCIDNSDYPVSLEPRKIYEALPDTQAEKLGQIRVVDESGEDYLYPSERCTTLTKHPKIKRTHLLAPHHCQPTCRRQIRAERYRNVLVSASDSNQCNANHGTHQ